MLSLFKSAVEKNRTENCFARVGKNRRTIGPTGFEFTFTEIDKLPDLNLGGNLVESLFTNQIGAHTRKHAFGEMTVAQEKGVADHTVEYRVTQKFKTFVVFGRKTAVRKRALQSALFLN